MLLFIGKGPVRSGCTIIISKHLMLLFIRRWIKSGSFVYRNFKTSHVAIYLFSITILLNQIFISKHLMLLFIHKLTPFLGKLFEFQNISCCYLSFSVFFLCCIEPDFKTSHVAIYLRCGELAYKWMEISKHLMLLFIEISVEYDGLTYEFQNISCCYLSASALLTSLSEIYFKTSHVAIYPSTPSSE